LTEIADLPLHVLNFRNLVIAFLCRLRLLIRAEGRRLELLVQIIDFVERFFVIFRPVVIFFPCSIFGIVDFCLSFLGFGILIKCALHIDRADFQCALCERRKRKAQH
jgi:hypothetical protein